MAESPTITNQANGRQDAVEALNRVLFRLPMVAGILRKINESALPSPGDDELRRGCERAITSILAELARLNPAGHACDGLKTSDQWLDEKLRNTLDVVTVERIEQLIARILANRA